MNGLESVLTKIMSHTQDEVNPEQPEDFIGEDGLLYCGACGRKKQARIKLLGREMIVPVICKCVEDEMKRQKEEDEKRQRMQVVESLKKTSLMSEKLRVATFESYIRRPENEKAYAIARNYADGFKKMYEENQGLLLYGPVGTGKSYTAACIANQLLNNGTSVVMTSFIKILQEIQSGNMDEGSYISKLNNARLLIIDDLGAERNTDYALEKVYNIIDSRVRSNKPMILTTNLTLEYMKDPQDIRYTRIYDRIFETCYPLHMTGRSFRLDEGNRRFTRMRELLEANNGRERI